MPPEFVDQWVMSLFEIIAMISKAAPAAPVCEVIIDGTAKRFTLLPVLTFAAIPLYVSFKYAMVGFPVSA